MKQTSTSKGVDVLLVAAYAPELAGMQPLLGDQLHGDVANITVSCSAVGVGLPNATASTTMRVLQLRPRAVVLVGTCGAYFGLGPNIGEVVVARSVVLVDPVEVDGNGAMPAPIGRRIECNPVIALALAGGPEPLSDVANTLGVTTDDALATRIGAVAGCAVENLEAFGIASACALLQVPFACVLGVSNRVGSMGREEWRQHAGASNAACDLIRRWLTAGAIGLPQA